MFQPSDSCEDEIFDVRCKILATDNSNNCVRPKIGEFQLLGDSIFVRFSSNVLYQPSSVIAGTGCIGYCVSGQRVKQLTHKIKKGECMLSTSVMILIGTNDILCGRDLSTMVRHYTRLIEVLRVKCVKKFVLLTVPPVPKLSLLRSHWEVLRGFNQFLMSLNDPDEKVHVIDILPIFMKQDCTLLASPPAYRKRQLQIGLNETNPYETPKKISKMLAPHPTEEDDAKLSPFGRYLNRINREERILNEDSSEDDEPRYQRKAAIDPTFWRSLRRQLGLSSPKITRFSSPTPETPEKKTEASPTTLWGFSIPKQIPTDPAEPVVEVEGRSNMTETEKKIMEYTQNFLNLDLYEHFYGNSNSGRVDLIHPNRKGLFRLHKLLIESKIF